MSGPLTEARLSPTVFSILSSLVEEHAGLCYTPADREIFESKVCARAAEAGFETALDYYYFLRYDDKGRAELQALIEALVVHETFFFRELEPLRVMVSHFVEPLVARGERPRIWCAASSTGEEPLTVAMLLAGAKLLSGVDLIASDVSATVLARARRAQYAPRTLRRVPIPAFAKNYVADTAEGVYVAPELRSAIDWRQINLMNAAEVEAIGEVDVILCRNVLIYFRDGLARRVVDALAARLRPGGALFVGVSESITRLGTALACEEHGGAFVYRKQAAS